MKSARSTIATKPKRRAMHDGGDERAKEGEGDVAARLPDGDRDKGRDQHHALDGDVENIGAGGDHRRERRQQDRRRLHQHRSEE